MRPPRAGPRSPGLAVLVDRAVRAEARWNLRWPYTRQLPNVRRVHHAVSIDEKRRPCREYLVTPDKKHAAPGSVEQVWFAGVHSDVGGTFDGDPRLPTIALKRIVDGAFWIVDGAFAEGLLLKTRASAREVTLVPEDALGKVHRIGWICALLTYRRRRLPRGAQVHASVRARLRKDPEKADRIPPEVAWSDTEWLTLDGRRYHRRRAREPGST